jgi:alpha-D-xyloside xylohydrolase
MPFRPPLVAHEYFSADPPELPRRRRGEAGPREITHAELMATEPNGISVKAHATSGDLLTAQVTAAGEGIIRVRLSSDPAARSRSARTLPLTHPDLGYQADVTVAGGLIRIVAGALTAEVLLEPWRIRFLDTAGGRELTRTAPGVTDISGRMRTAPFGVSMVDGEIAAYHETLDLPADEVLVGTGERFTPLNLRGQRPLMWNFDAFGSESDRAYKNVPFYQSSRGYGIVVDSGMPIEFDFGASTQSVTQIVVPDDLIDYYVLAGPTPGEVLARYNRLTCRPVTPPKWAFGSWISSGFFVDTQELVLERARTIRARGIPCDVLHLDTYWQPDGMWSELRWDPRTFPNPEAMLAELDALGFKVCLWMNSYISVRSDRFTEAAERGYLLKRADGEPYVADSWHGSFPECGIVDFTNPAATAWFQDLLRPLAAIGVQVFKTDFAEGVPADCVAYNGMSGTELHNIYSLLFNDAVSAVTREAHGHAMVWGRSSYLGGQRHAAQWSGDTMCTYPALASTMNGGLAHGLSGVPFWSHDTGGFSGTPSDDLFLRWAQFGALSPLLRFHGTTSREPWRFPAVEAGVIEALRLRYRLLPYLYTAALRSGETGEPLMRALMVDSPADPLAWRAEHEYRLGPDLLIAPVISEEQERHVYLPAGEWADWWSGAVVTGPASVRATPAPAEMPFYARVGALLPTTAAEQSIPDGPWKSITLLSVGGLSGTSEIRDDDGVTSVTAVREGAMFTITTSGPARVERVEFAQVAGYGIPNVVVLNGSVLE